MTHQTHSSASEIDSKLKGDKKTKKPFWLTQRERKRMEKGLEAEKPKNPPKVFTKRNSEDFVVKPKTKRRQSENLFKTEEITIHVPRGIALQQLIHQGITFLKLLM